MSLQPERMICTFLKIVLFENDLNFQVPNMSILKLHRSLAFILMCQPTLF